MSEDPVVDEIRKRREERAARFEFNVRAIAEDARERERKSNRTVVEPPSRQAAD